MMTLPLHHHDMEAGIICDKNGKPVIEVQDNLDADDVLRAVNFYEDNLETIRWMAQTVHQAYHEKDTFMECSKNVCDAAKQAIAKAEGQQP